MLVGNRSAISKSPGNFLSGTALSGDRSNFRILGNRFQSLSRLSAVPNGHLSPSAWSLPRTGGAMSSHNFADVRITPASLNIAAGVNAAGLASLTITADALGQLIASASGAASLTITADGSIVASLGAAGVASLAITGAATAGALANGSGVASLVITGALVSYATGSMSGLAKLAGESLENDLDAEIEGGYTAKQVLRLLLAAVAGKTAGVGTSTETYRGVDGTTPRIVTTFDASSNRLTVTLDGG